MADISTITVDNVKYDIKDAQARESISSLDIPKSPADIGAVAVTDITQTLGSSTTKVPSEKAVSDAITNVGQGDMKKDDYDANGDVKLAGGIDSFVNNKIDEIAYPVTSVNNKKGAVVLTATDVGAMPSTTIIPVVNDAKLTIQKNGTKVAEFTANDADDITANIVVPTQASDINAVPDTRTVNSKQLNQNITLTPADIGALSDNTVYVATIDGESGAVTSNMVKYVSQALTDAQKTQARTNIGAGDGNYDNLTNKPSIPSKTSDITNDSGFITSAQAPVQSINNKTGAVSLVAGDIGAVSTSDVTTTLGSSTTKVPSEKAVSDAITAAGGGDMMRATYDATNAVADAGGIVDYVMNNAPVVSVNTKTGAVTLSKSDIGLSNVDNVRQYSASNPPPYPEANKNKLVSAQPTNMNSGDIWYKIKT